MTGGEGLEVLVAVGNKTLPVTQIEKPVIGERIAGQFVDGEVGTTMRKWFCHDVRLVP